MLRVRARAAETKAALLQSMAPRVAVHTTGAPSPSTDIVADCLDQQVGQAVGQNDSPAPIIVPTSQHVAEFSGRIARREVRCMSSARRLAFLVATCTPHTSFQYQSIR